MLYSKIEKNGNKTRTNVFYYKPEGYRDYISFTKTAKDMFGVPQHHVKLPEGVTEVKGMNKALESRIKFLELTKDFSL